MSPRVTSAAAAAAAAVATAATVSGSGPSPGPDPDRRGGGGGPGPGPWPGGHSQHHVGPARRHAGVPSRRRGGPGCGHGRLHVAGGPGRGHGRPRVASATSRPVSWGRTPSSACSSIISHWCHWPRTALLAVDSEDRVQPHPKKITPQEADSGLGAFFLLRRCAALALLQSLLAKIPIPSTDTHIYGHPEYSQ